MIYLQKMGIPLKAITDSAGKNRDRDRSEALVSKCAGSDRLRRVEVHPRHAPERSGQKSHHDRYASMGREGPGTIERRKRIGSILPTAVALIDRALGRIVANPLWC